MVSGLSGRNLGGRALWVKFEFRSHTENRILGTHCREENPFVADRLNPALRCWGCVDGNLTGNCLRQKTFPLQAACLHSLCKQLRFSLLSLGWHSQAWELVQKDPACSDSVCCTEF